MANTVSISGFLIWEGSRASIIFLCFGLYFILKYVLDSYFPPPSQAELVAMMLRWLPEDITVHNEDLEGLQWNALVHLLCFYLFEHVFVFFFFWV